MSGAAVRTRLFAAAVVTATALCAGYLAVRAVALFRTGQLDAIGLGIGVLLLVVVGAVLLVGEVRLGLGSQRLARLLDAEGVAVDTPADLPRMPSGRLTTEAADALFAERKAEVEAAPEDWRAWWRLASAYGEARDTARGRQAMRKAIALERASRSR